MAFLSAFAVGSCPARGRRWILRFGLLVWAAVVTTCIASEETSETLERRIKAAFVVKFAAYGWSAGRSMAVTVPPSSTIR